MHHNDYSVVVVLSLHILCLQYSTILAFVCNVNSPFHVTRQVHLFETAETTTIAGQYKAPKEEIDRRRNLAIISHPDSGKTTMTEKLLLYGGALQQAGAVRQKAEQRATQSDFMAMEQERGISISSTVMNFDYEGYRLNILDTPGHQE
jgi:hypothetical protein